MLLRGAKGLVLGGLASSRSLVAARSSVCRYPSCCHSAHGLPSFHPQVFRTCARSVPLAAGQHIAGADRVPRGKTWAIFMLRALLTLVLSLLAAAHLNRWHGCGCSPVKLLSRTCTHPGALAPLCVPNSSASSAVHVPVSRSYAATRCRGARAQWLGVILFAGRSPRVRVPLPVLVPTARTSCVAATARCSARARTAAPWQPANTSLELTACRVAKRG